MAGRARPLEWKPSSIQVGASVKQLARKVTDLYERRHDKAKPSSPGARPSPTEHAGERRTVMSDAASTVHPSEHDYVNVAAWRSHSDVARIPPQPLSAKERRYRQEQGLDHAQRSFVSISDSLPSEDSVEDAPEDSAADSHPEDLRKSLEALVLRAGCSTADPQLVDSLLGMVDQARRSDAQTTYSEALLPPGRTMPKPAQDDYKRYPKSMRGTPEEVLEWEGQTRDGLWDLSDEERFWHDVQPLFLERGYSLRPRYLPGWTPSWAGTNIHPINFEDSWGTLMPGVIDARKADGTVVAIKWIPPEEHTRNELDVLRFLSSDSLRHDPRNHCLTLLDSFDHPTITGGVFVVTPWLLSLVSMPVKYVNDVVDFMLQTFEGLAFMHENGVSHRDCTDRNIMVDATSLIPKVRWHPQHPTHTEQWDISPEPLPRCQASARYVFIDFGISSRSSPGELVVGDICRDHTAPELSVTVPYDPFMLDVYLLGNFFWTEYISKFRNLEFLRPVVDPMTRKDPRERPTINEALAHLRAAAQKPRGPSFRWRLRPPSESRSSRIFEDACCVIRELYYWTRVPFRGLRELRFGRP